MRKESLRSSSSDAPSQACSLGRLIVVSHRNGTQPPLQHPTPPDVEHHADEPARKPFKKEFHGEQVADEKRYSPGKSRGPVDGQMVQFGKITLQAESGKYPEVREDDRSHRHEDQSIQCDKVQEPHHQSRE